MVTNRFLVQDALSYRISECPAKSKDAAETASRLQRLLPPHQNVGEPRQTFQRGPSNRVRISSGRMTRTLLVDQKPM